MCAHVEVRRALDLMRAHMLARRLKASIARAKRTPQRQWRMYALITLGVRINASGTPIEYTNARHVTAAAHTNLQPSERHAKLARGGGRARAHHIPW